VVILRGRRRKRCEAAHRAVASRTNYWLSEKRPKMRAPSNSCAGPFFNTFNTCVYDAPPQPSFGGFDADQSRHTFQIRQVLIEGSTSTISGTYELENERLRLNGTRNGQPISFVLSRLRYRKQSALY
jgi:hypothetical protein